LLVLVIIAVGIAVGKVGSQNKLPVASNNQQSDSNNDNSNSQVKDDTQKSIEEATTVSSDQQDFGTEQTVESSTTTNQNQSSTGKNQVNVLVSSVTLDRAGLDLMIGETFHTIAAVSPDSATNKNLRWSSNDPSIARVDDDGAVSGIKAGNTEIVAAAQDGSGKSASIPVTVWKLQTFKTGLNQAVEVASSSGPVRLRGEVDVDANNSIPLALSLPGIGGGAAVTFFSLDPAIIPAGNIPFTGLDISFRGITDQAKVELPLPAGLSADQAGAFHYGDGIWQFRAASVENGKISFMTNLSPVAVTKKVVVPTGLSAVYSQTTNAVSVNWTAVNDSDISYRLYKDGQFLTSTASTSYTDFAPSDGTHTYTVRAYRGLFESDLSAAASCTVEKPVAATISIRGGTEITFPVNGSITTPAFTAAVQDKNGLNLPWEHVTWSLKTAAEGVSIDADSGVITIKDNAIANTITLVASSVSISSVTASQEITLRQLSSISISGGVSFVVIPASGSITTTGFKAAVEDQNGKAFEAEKVTWSLQSLADGVSVDPATGAITVMGTTTADTISLVVTSLSKPSITASREIALRSLTSVNISGPTSILIPESGSSTTSFTAVVQDQKGDTIEGEKVTWSLQTPASGVSADSANGTVTVQNTTTADSVTLVATSQTKTSVIGSVDIKLTTLDDESTDKANLISTDGTAQTHVIFPDADQDWFKFQAQAGKVYTIKTANVSESLATSISLFGQDGVTGLAENSLAASAGFFEEWFSRIDWVAPASGTYYMKVTSYAFLDNPPGTGVYSILVKQGDQEFAAAVSAVGNLESMVSANDDPVTAYQTYLQAKKLIDVLPDGDGKNELKIRLGYTDFYFEPSPATNATFEDSDTHWAQLGGSVTWTLPASEKMVDGYKIYFVSKDGYQLGDAIGEVQAGTNSFTVPAGLAVPPQATQIGVYSYNSPNESTEPALLMITDNGSGDTAPNISALQDGDTTAGVDGRDFALTWNVTTWPGAVKQEIFIFPDGSSFDVFQTPAAKFDDKATNSWTGDSTLSKDSMGNAFVSGQVYKVYVVVYGNSDSDGWFWYWQSSPATITPTNP